jgi:hypothetical protein
VKPSQHTTNTHEKYDHRRCCPLTDQQCRQLHDAYTSVCEDDLSFCGGTDNIKGKIGKPLINTQPRSARHKSRERSNTPVFSG